MKRTICICDCCEKETDKVYRLILPRRGVQKCDRDGNFYTFYTDMNSFELIEQDFCKDCCMLIDKKLSLTLKEDGSSTFDRYE